MKKLLSLIVGLLAGFGAQAQTNIAVTNVSYLAFSNILRQSLDPTQFRTNVWPYSITNGTSGGTNNVTLTATNNILITTNGGNNYTIGGDLTNGFVVTNDLRKLTLTNTNNILGASNLFLNSNPILSGTNPNPTARIYIKQGLVSSPDDANFNLFGNTAHGGFGSGVEWQMTFNQWAFGVPDGGHIQFGLVGPGTQNNYFYAAHEASSAGNETNGHSASIGFQLAYTDTNGFKGNSVFYFQSTNLNNGLNGTTNALSEVVLLGPTGNPNQDVNQQGPAIAHFGQDGSIRPSVRFVRPNSTVAVSGTNHIVNYTNQQDVILNISTNLNLIDSNLSYYANVTVEKDYYISSGLLPVLLTTPTNWQWESISLLPAPTNVPSQTTVHIHLNAEIGATTNVYASYKLSTYTYNLDANASAFFTASGISDGTIKSAINNFCINAKNKGYFSKMIAIYPYVGGTSNTCSWNLVDTTKYREAWTGPPTFNANGITGNGTTAYGVSSNLIPNTVGGGMNTTNTFAGVWIKTLPTVNNCYIFADGLFSGAAPLWGAQFATPNVETFVVMNAAVGGATFTIGTGLNAQSKTGSTTETDVFGSGIIDQTGLTAATGLPSSPFIVLARSDASSLSDHFSDETLDGAFVGFGMSDADIANLIVDWTALNTTLGR